MPITELLYVVNMERSILNLLDRLQCLQDSQLTQPSRLRDTNILQRNCTMMTKLKFFSSGFQQMHLPLKYFRRKLFPPSHVSCEVLNYFVTKT